MTWDMSGTRSREDWGSSISSAQIHSHPQVAHVVMELEGEYGILLSEPWKKNEMQVSAML